MPNIVLVDDDDDLRSMLVLILESLGHPVRQARDGAQALGLVRESVPDLVITDLSMPGLNGLELIERLRRRHPNLKFVLITGDSEYAAGSEPEHPKTGGPVLSLAKPFSRQQIESAIKTALFSPSPK